MDAETGMLSVTDEEKNGIMSGRSFNKMGYNTWIFSITGKYTFEVTFLSPAGIQLLSYCMVLAAGSKKWTLKERTIFLKKKGNSVNKTVHEFDKGKYLFMLTGVLDLCS